MGSEERKGPGKSLPFASTGFSLLFFIEKLAISGDYKENRRKCDAEFHKINELSRTWTPREV